MSSQSPVHRRALDHVTRMARPGPPLPSDVRVTINFHPDRFTVQGQLVLGAMAVDCRFRSQFETSTSNGGLTAFPGGDRWHWESRLFGGVYDDVPDVFRPVYGALDLYRRGFGGAVRFGSAHLRLAPSALERVSLCFPDSVFDPVLVGTSRQMALDEVDVADVDLLDDYVEAHVHGGVRFAGHPEAPDGGDVEAVVLDPSFRGTDIEAAASRLGCPVEWHQGLVATVTTLRRHPDYRGQRYVDLASQIAVAGVVTPRIIGDVSRTGQVDEKDLKRVWHLLARFGSPAS